VDSSKLAGEGLGRNTTRRTTNDATSDEWRTARRATNDERRDAANGATKRTGMNGGKRGEFRRLPEKASKGWGEWPEDRKWQNWQL